MFFRRRKPQPPVPRDPHHDPRRPQDAPPRPRRRRSRGVTVLAIIGLITVAVVLMKYLIIPLLVRLGGNP